MRDVSPIPERVSGPMAEPLSIEELKLNRRTDDDYEDTDIQGMMLAAREYLEDACERTFCTTTWRVKLRRFCGRCIPLPMPPLVSVSSVAYLDANSGSATVSTSDYHVVTSERPGVIELAYNAIWPVTAIHPEAVTITYVAGSSTVPELVKQGIKLLVGHWYENREAMAELKAGGEIPYGVEAIVNQLRAYRF